MKKNYTTLTLIILSLCLYTLSGRGQTKLGNDINGTAANDRSGSAVSVSADGKIMAIGAPLNSTSKGQVRIYEYKTNASGSLEWIQLGQTLEGEADYDWSGRSVSLSADGKTVAIGAVQVTQPKGLQPKQTPAMYRFTNTTALIPGGKSSEVPLTAKPPMTGRVLP